MKNFNIKYFILVIIVVFFSITSNTYADTYQTGVVDVDFLSIRSDAGTSYKKIGTAYDKETLIINSTKSTQDSSTGCGSGSWYHITTTEGDIFSGYVCSSYITNIKTINDTPSESCNMSDLDFEAYLKTQGFPTSYWDKLKALHKSHPCWIFKANNSKYSWSNALDQQSVLGRSLYQVTSDGVSNGLQGYLSTASEAYNYYTDTFKPYDGSYWYQANNQTIEYYMDPRNFLTETGIFMFEDLTFYESYQTSETVKKILYTDFYINYIQHYITAAKKYNVSPIYLAALTRQEVGLNSNTATSGKAGSYNGTDYNGYYNFYNIGASSGTNPVYNGLSYSKKSGWTSPELAIVNGAAWIVDGYINRGQYTRYYQKWNVSSTTTTGIWHQYATDIRTVVSPAVTTAAVYKGMGISNESIVFTIPVYIGMPSSTTLPNTGNPNNWLKELKIDGENINNFSSSNTSYNYGDVAYNKTSVKIEGKTINSNASIDGLGEIPLEIGSNTIKVIVNAQNGSKKTYSITIKRREGVTDGSEPSVSLILNNISIKNNEARLYGFNIGTTASTLSQNILKQNANGIIKITNKSGNTKASELATGDKVTISSNNETKTFEVVIYGDLNGDSGINAKDLLLMRKYLLKETNLDDSYLEAAKIVKDTTVSAKDLLQLRKHLLGTASIKQG